MQRPVAVATMTCCVVLGVCACASWVGPRTPAQAQTDGSAAPSVKTPPTQEMQKKTLKLTAEPAPPASEQPAVVSRWKGSFDAFAAADKARSPQPGGVVFVGSSSIRLWNDLEKQFNDPVAIVNRGFGGSTLQDVTENVNYLVLPYKPRLVVVYAGDNDLAEGRSPQQVMTSFKDFVSAVRAELPQTRIAYVSIKPSPLRSRFMVQARESNALISAYCRATPNLDYIDVYSRMLDAEGQPRGDLFVADKLHMNEQGYALWKSVISAHLHAVDPKQ